MESKNTTLYTTWCATYYAAHIHTEITWNQKNTTKHIKHVIIQHYTHYGALHITRLTCILRYSGVQKSGCRITAESYRFI